MQSPASSASILESSCCGPAALCRRRTRNSGSRSSRRDSGSDLPFVVSHALMSFSCAYGTRVAGNSVRHSIVYLLMDAEIYVRFVMTVFFVYFMDRVAKRLFNALNRSLTDFLVTFSRAFAREA